MVGGDAGACVADGEPDLILDTLDTDDDLGPPAGVNLRALPRRFVSTWRMRAGLYERRVPANDVGPQQNVARRGLRPERLDRFVYDPSGSPASRLTASMPASMLATSTKSPTRRAMRDAGPLNLPGVV